MSKRTLLFDLLILLFILLVFIHPILIGDPTCLADVDNNMSLAWHQYALISFNQGEFPYWDPYNYHNFFTTATWIFYPVHFIWYMASSYFSLDADIKSTYVVFAVILFFHLYLSSATMYGFLRSLEIERTCSLFGSIIYTYNLYTLVMGGILNSYIRMSQYAFTPLLFLFIIKLLKSRKYWIEWMILTGLALGVSILCGQIQPIIYYFPIFFAFVIWFMVYIQKRPEKIEIAKRLLALCGVLLIAFGITAIESVPVFFHIPYVIRSVASFEEIMGLSMSPFYSIMASIYPSFDKDPNLTNYVGGPFWEAILYSGTISIIFSIFGLFSRHKYLSFFIFILIFSMFIIVGKYIFVGYLHYSMAKYLLRYPVRGNIVFMFAISFFASVGLEYLSKLFGFHHNKDE